MKKLLVVFVAAVMLSCTFAEARGGHRGYHYAGGHWWLGSAIIAGLVVGSVIATLPPRHEVVYVSGNPYYYDGTYYYRRDDEGYVVVQPDEYRPVTHTEAVVPTQSFPPTPENRRSVTVKVRNSNGTVSEVMLVRKGSGYVGPEGEYYESMPTVKQLNAVYGQ
jgi:hypothetical protein